MVRSWSHDVGLSDLDNGIRVQWQGRFDARLVRVGGHGARMACFGPVVVTAGRRTGHRLVDDFARKWSEAFQGRLVA